MVSQYTHAISSDLCIGNVVCSPNKSGIKRINHN